MLSDTEKNTVQSNLNDNKACHFQVVVGNVVSFEPTEDEIDKASIECFNESYLNVKMTEAQIENTLDAFKSGVEYAIQKMKNTLTDKQIRKASLEFAKARHDGYYNDERVQEFANGYVNVFCGILAKLKESV